LNNHKQNILSNKTIRTKQSLTLNTDPSPLTANNFNVTIKLPALELINQPNRFWHNRELGTLGKGCPAVQVEGAPKSKPFLIKVIDDLTKSFSYSIIAASGRD
jgi:hypothetical protein